MSELKIKIDDYDDPAALLHPDPSLTSRHQIIFLLLNPKSRSAGVTVLKEVVCDSTPMEVYHNRRYRIDLPGQTDATKLRQWVSSRADLINTIFDGHSIEWDGSNNVGKLNQDARIAMDRLLALTSDKLAHPSHRLYGMRENLPDLEFNEVSREAVDVPTHDIRLWDAAEWATPAEKQIIEDYDLSENMSEEQLKETARDLEEEARTMANIKLYGTLDYLKGLF